MRVSETNIEANSESSSPTRLRNKSFGMPISSRRITNWIDINPGGLITVFLNVFIFFYINFFF